MRWKPCWPSDLPCLDPSLISHRDRFRLLRRPAMAGPVDSHRDAADDKDVSYRGRSTAARLPTISAGAVMGIQDREYYRGETRGSGWLSGGAPVCKTIILINVLVFILQRSLPHEFVEDYLAASADGIL